MEKKNDLLLFANQDPTDTNDWRKEWMGMPEYNNQVQPEPAIVVTFKFKTQEDFNKFNGLVKKYLYGGEKVFDGMQRKDRKQAWYPLLPKASQYRYE